MVKWRKGELTVGIKSFIFSHPYLAVKFGGIRKETLEVPEALKMIKYFSRTATELFIQYLMKVMTHTEWITGGEMVLRAALLCPVPNIELVV